MPAENCMVGGCREAAGAVAIRWGGPGGACGKPAGWPGIHGVPAVAGGPGAACWGRPFALACCCVPVWGVQGMSCGGRGALLLPSCEAHAAHRTPFS